MVFTCRICPFEIGNKGHMLLHTSSHIKTNSNQREWPCMYCGAPFYSRTKMHTHVRRLHSDQRAARYMNAIEKHGFKVENPSQAKVVPKSTPKIFSNCSKCPALFTNNEDMMKHMRQVLSFLSVFCFS